MYPQPRYSSTQPKESRIPLLTPHRTRSTGLASGDLLLPSRTSSQASLLAHSDIPVLRSIVFAQNSLAHLMAIKEQPEGNSVLDPTILTPVSPRTIAEPSPRQALRPQLSPTPTPYTPAAPDEASAQKIREWYSRMTGLNPQLGASSTPNDPFQSALPGTPFRGPYPSFEASWERTPSATPQLFPCPHCVGTVAP